MAVIMVIPHILPVLMPMPSMMVPAQLPAWPYELAI